MQHEDYCLFGKDMPYHATINRYYVMQHIISRFDAECLLFGVSKAMKLGLLEDASRLSQLEFAQVMDFWASWDNHELVRQVIYHTF